MQRILIIRLSAIGDVLFAMPAVQALRERFPQARIDWLVEDRAASLLELYPAVSDTLVYPRSQLVRLLRHPLRFGAGLRLLLRHVRRVRGERYDLVIDFQGNLKSGLHRLLARGERKVGFARGHCKEGNHLLPGEAVRPGPDEVHRVDRSQALVRAVVSDSRPVRPLLRLRPEQEAFADHVRKSHGWQPGQFVVLHPGTSAFGAFKRWAPDRFALLADLLHAEHQIPSLITWGPGEEELARSVLESTRRGGAFLSPRTGSLGDLAALLRQSRVLVGSDSAPLHLAAFQGTKVVALFGPKDPLMYGPRFAEHRIVHTYLHCSPCTRRTCPDVLCMGEISVPQVLQATVELWHAASLS